MIENNELNQKNDLQNGHIDSRTINVPKLDFLTDFILLKTYQGIEPVLKTKNALLNAAVKFKIAHPGDIPTVLFFLKFLNTCGTSTKNHSTVDV